MKIRLVIILFISSIFCYANDAYVKVAGGNILPLDGKKNTQIQMIEETINIILHKDFYEINVDFLFKNFGDETSVLVGFPQWKNRQQTSDVFYNFITKLNGNVILYQEKLLVTPEKISENLLITKWYTREVVFPKEGITQTSISYSAPYGIYGLSESIDYLYGTGSTWKDSIGKITIIINNQSIRWINDIKIGSVSEYEPIRNGEVVTIVLKDITAAKDDCIELIIDNLPKGLVTNRKIDPEKNWFYNTALIKPRDLIFLSNDQLRLLRNLLFAAHGNIFMSEDINEWLERNCSSWYVPKKNVKENSLLDIELQNLKIIQAEESQRKT